MPETRETGKRIVMTDRMLDTLRSACQEMLSDIDSLDGADEEAQLERLLAWANYQTAKRIARREVPHVR